MSTPATGGIGRDMAKGAAWTILMRLLVRGISLISTVILARLLSPADYGLIAIATVLVGVLEGLTAFGFDVVLIQDQQAPADKYHTAWTLDVVRGVLLGAVLITVAPLVAHFYGDERLTAVLRLLALGTMIEGAESVGVVDFRKFLRFDKDFVLMLVPKVAAFVVTVSVAVALRNYWALAVGVFVGRAVRVATGYVMHPYRPRFCLRYWREVFHFSKWLMLNSMLRYLQNHADTLILGRYVTAQILGFYTLAYELSNLALSELVAPIQRVLLPGYARIAGNRDALRGTFLDTFSMTVTLALPAAIGIALTASYSVPLLLGAKWTQSIPIVRVLAICGALRLAVANSGAVYLAIGRPSLTTSLYVVTVAAGVPLLIVGVQWGGAMGAAYAVTAAAGVFAIANLVLLRLAVGVGAGDLWAAAGRSVVATAAMALAVHTESLLWQAPAGPAQYALQLMGACFAGVLVQVLVQIALWLAAGRPPGAERAILREVRHRLGLGHVSA